MSSKAKTHPLPLANTLRDLALLRASDCDLTSVLPAHDNPTSKEPADGESGSVDVAVEQSYEFVKEARAVIRLLNRNEVEMEGARLEELRSKLEDVSQGLQGSVA